MSYTSIKTLNTLASVLLSNTTKQAFDTINNNAAECDTRANRADAKFEAIEAALLTFVRFDINNQGLTDTQKANARTNIGAQETLAAQTAYSSYQGSTTKVPKIKTNALGQVIDIDVVDIAFPVVQTDIANMAKTNVDNNFSVGQTFANGITVSGDTKIGTLYIYHSYGGDTGYTKILEYDGSDDDYVLHGKNSAVAIGEIASKSYAQGLIKNGTLTLQVEGTTKTTFGANQSSNVTFNITASDLGLSAAMKYIGTTTTAISDGSTTNPITIGGSSVTAASGNVVLYGNKEFIWNGTSWEELGDEGSYALKTVSITGTGALSGGGTIEASRTITHNAGNAASQASGFYKFSTDEYSHVNGVSAVVKKDLTDLITSMTAAASGTDLSLVTTGEKYTWNNKVDKNAAITGATKCKITYDSKGLVTAGADLALSDITAALGFTPSQAVGYPFTTSTTGWAQDSTTGIWTLTVTDSSIVGKHPFVCYNSSNEQVMVTLGFSANNITIKSDQKFQGTVYAI